MKKYSTMKSQSSAMKPTDNLSKLKKWRKKEPLRKPLNKLEKLLERWRKLKLRKPINKPQAPNLNCNKLRIPSNKSLNKKKLLLTLYSNFKTKSPPRRLKPKQKSKLKNQLKKRNKPKRRLPRKPPTKKPVMNLYSKKNKKKKPPKRPPKSWLLKPRRRQKLLPLKRRLKMISTLQQLLPREQKKQNKEN